MSLSDRLRMITLTDSIGYHVGFHSNVRLLGITTNNVLSEWSKRKEKFNSSRQEYNKRKDTKRLRIKKLICGIQKLKYLNPKGMWL